jgi:hypothetical protein
MIYKIYLVVNLSAAWPSFTARTDIRRTSMPKASANIASKADAHFDPTEYVDLMVDLGALPTS